MLKTILVTAALGALSLAPLSASAREATPQQSRMATCNKEAVGKKGDERKAFMKQCLSGKADASAAAAAPKRAPR